MVALDETNVTRITAHHEVSGAYMADGYARASRKPGIIMGQAVGNVNIAAGLRDAYLAGSPVIAISGGSPVASRYRDVYQIIEDFPVFESITKFNVRVEKADRLGELLRQAFRVANTGNPGPVHLEIPGRTGEGIDTVNPRLVQISGQTDESEGNLDVIIEEQYAHYPVFRPEADMTSILNAAAILAAAERPVIVAGAGAVASGAHQELVKLAEKLSIPVGTTPSGKEMILEDHPLAIGVVGSYGRWSSNKIVQEADVVFFAGSSAGDLATAAWKVPGPGANVIHLNIDPTVIGKHYPAKVALVGDAKATLSRFIEVSKPSQPRTAWVSRAQDLLRKWRDEIAPTGNSDESPMRPERLCKEISEWLPSNAVVVSDTGHAAIWSATMIGLKHADQRYIRCAGTLGWGLPGAMGVKCALPDRPVVCFTGDGGLWYHIGELETAARAGINIIVVVNNNSCLQQVIKGFNAAYGGASNTGKARVMWYFQETNFAKIAENMGCIGIRVERPHDLKEAFNRALKANKPVVIDVVSDDQAAPTWG